MTTAPRTPQNSTRWMYAPGTRESREDEQENEDVVDGERLLDQLAGQKPEAALGAMGPGEPDVEEAREADPEIGRASCRERV